MARVEIDEEEFRQNGVLRQTMTQILANPKARKLLLEARKTADPNAVIPELEQVSAVESKIGELQKTVTDFISEQKTAAEKKAEEDTHARITSRIESGFQKLKEAGVTAEGLEGVKKIMEDEGIISPEVAWSHFEKLHPQPAITTPSGYGSFNFLDQPADSSEDIKKLIDTRGNSEQVLNKMASDALAELRGTPRR